MLFRCQAWYHEILSGRQVESRPIENLDKNSMHVNSDPIYSIFLAHLVLSILLLFISLNMSPLLTGHSWCMYVTEYWLM